VVRRARTGFICYSPLQAGLLTDTFSAERPGADGQPGLRRWHIDFTHFARPRAGEPGTRDRLRPLPRATTPRSRCRRRWVLSWPGVTGAIVGPRSPDQVDGWIGAAGFS